MDEFYAYTRWTGGQIAGWKSHANRENRDESARILRRFTENKKTFVLEHEGEVIGSLGIERYDEARFPEPAELRCREIGYVRSKEYWDRGLMPEAVSAAIRCLFKDVQLDAILCGHFLRNRQSARVQQSAAFATSPSASTGRKLARSRMMR